MGELRRKNAFIAATRRWGLEWTYRDYEKSVRRIFRSWPLSDYNILAYLQALDSPFNRKDTEEWKEELNRRHRIRTLLMLEQFIRELIEKTEELKIAPTEYLEQQENDYRTRNIAAGI